jgi:UDP-N-acetyl-D-mannosaminuronic acid dehydrogenase
MGAGTTYLDLCIVGGCGRVGLPLALRFAHAGLSVGIFDVDEAAMAEVRAGRMPFLERGGPELLAEALRLGRLELSADASILKRAPAVILVPGTPIDEFLNPSLRVFDRILDEVVPFLPDGALVVLRSTAYPGTTEWVAAELDSRGRGVDVAFCPERIAEGRALEELGTLPQIVGADTERAAARAEALFSRLGVETIRTTTKEAELAKLFTNAWRYLKFAVANQFFVIASEAGLDYERILHAVRHHYPRAEDLPGPGFAAGPCLFKDTMQLSAFTNNGFLLGHAAMLANESLPDFVVARLRERIELKGRTVAILGMAFKAESDDTRASLSYKLRKLLWFAGARVVCTDPYVQGPDIVPLEEALGAAEIVVIGAPHRRYRTVDFGERLVVDIWGLTGRGLGL